MAGVESYVSLLDVLVSSDSPQIELRVDGEKAFEAFRQAEAPSERFDLVLMDINVRAALTLSFCSRLE